MKQRNCTFTAKFVQQVYAKMSFSVKKLVVGPYKYYLNEVRTNKVHKIKGSFQFLLRKVPLDSITREECEELRELSHLNIQKIFCYENDRSSHYFAMEYGTELLDYLERKWISKPDVHEILELMRQATEGLKYLHDKNIIHKYLYPRNIFIEKNQARIANFTLQDSIEGTDFRKVYTKLILTNCFLNSVFISTGIYSPRTGLNSNDAH